MSAQANIVINDGAATPVARTFSPKGVRPIDPRTTHALWRDGSVTPFVAQPTIEEFHSAPNQQGIEKFKWVFKLPVAQTLGTNDAGYTPAPSVAYTVLGVLEVYVPTRATDLELSHLRAFIENFAATSKFEDAVELRDPTW
jgi:hypothetical protein